MPAWDAFLTDRDKEHTKLYWEKPGPFGFGTKPVLLVIDNVYSILGPRMPLMDVAGALSASCGLEGWQAIDRTVELIASARKHGVPVAYAKLRTDFPARARATRGAAESRPEGLIPAWMEERLPEIVEEIAPQDGDFVIAKTSASMFNGTPLSQYLTDLGADTIICCGNSTSGCVRATVVDGSAARYKVGVVEECTFDRTEASHAMSLFDMHQKYADVVSLAEADAYFTSVSTRELVTA